MDHLQSPKNPSYPPLEIVHLGFSYTNDTCIHAPSGLCADCDDERLSGWFGFPDRVGWDSVQILQGHLRKRNIEHQQLEGAPSFLQAWLYFGVLAFFFDDVAVIPAFVRQKENGSRVLDTSSLTERLLLWRRDLTAMSAQERTAALRRLDRMFGQLDNLCTLYLAGDGVVEDFRCPVSPELSLSIQILGETLYHAVHMAGGRRAPYVFGTGNTPLLLRRLQNNVWCPRDIENLGRICVTYYASTMGPRHHQVSHGNCTRERCCVVDVDELNYVTKHVQDGCQCEHIPVPLEDIVGILKNDEVPIIRWHEGTIQVMSSGRRDDRPKAPYVAISHVWADGLGNSLQNSLPLCQLHRIENLASTSFSSQQIDNTPVWFWLDTLCVPITKDGLTRKAAIARINRTYREATMTLVLDAELMHQSQNCSDTEVALRIVFSRWAQRLWTLQEAVASTVTVIQFADGCVNSTALENSIHEFGEDAGINDPILIRAYKWLRDLSRLRDSSTEQDERLVRTFQSTLERTASHERDELICTAGLIGFDQSQMMDLLDTPKDQRLYTFMRTLGKVPKHLVFAPRPKCKEYGFRWCPERLLASFRRVSSNPARAEFHTITPDGLQGTWHAIQFMAPSKDIGDSPDINEFDFVLDDQAHGFQHWVTPCDSTAVEALRSTTSEKLAILFEGLGLLAQDFGCLVEVTKQAGDVTFARLVGKCFLQLFEPIHPHIPGSMIIVEVAESGVPSEGVWCIE